MNTNPRSVGRVTVAIGLVAAGAALLSDNVNAAGPRYTELLLRLWPVFLIGFGLEYLICGLLERAGQRPLRFDFGGALLLAGALAVGSLVNAFSSDGSEISMPSVDVAPQTTVRTVPAAGATALNVNIDIGQVTLIPHSADEVRVEVEQTPGRLAIARESAAPVLDLQAEGGETVRVTGRLLAGGFNPGVWQTTYRIYAPADLAVTVRSDAGSIAVRGYDGSLDLATDAGSISVTDGSGTLAAEADSGSIQVLRFAGPVTATTTTGSLAAIAVDGALTLRSGTGVITVGDHGGAEMTAETRTGTITAALSAPPQGSITLRTATGSIQLTLPEASDASVRASTRSGRIIGMNTVSAEGPARTASITLGAGTHKVTLEANMGTIQLATR